MLSDQPSTKANKPSLTIHVKQNILYLVRDYQKNKDYFETIKKYEGSDTLKNNRNSGAL